MPRSTRLGLVAASAVAAESLTFPIDFAKTRMQLKVGRQTFIDALAKAIRHEGI
ncbi:PUMP3, partial [Symbiodinium microadriaticum]